MKGKKKKVYQSGGTIRNFIENPNTELQKSQQSIAKALHAGASNPLALGLKGVGNMMMGYGISQGGFGDSTEAQILNTLLPIAGNLEFANGGTKYQTGGTVEVEGEEVAQTPDGEMVKFKGPKHEQGGIDVNLPDGTDIYSDRVTIDGMTMAERKTKREKEKSKLEKYLDATDKISQNTYERGMEKINLEEEMDMTIQNSLNQTNQVFQNGGTTNVLGGATLGDVMSLLGIAGQGISPLIQNRKQAAATDPNINYFEQYGQEGLQKLDQAKSIIDQTKDSQLQSLALSENAAQMRNRSGARSINTMRALDLATTASANQAEAAINNQALNAMLGIISQEAQMENQQDQVVMGGEREKDLADRADLDAFMSNEAAAMQNLFASIGAVGEGINQIKKRQVTQNLLNQLSDYGLQIDNSGNLITK